MEPIKIIECPRDAFKPFIRKKVAYIQSLLRVGFDSIDFGSFVSKAIPQMQDTAAVLGQLDLSQTKATGYYCQYQSTNGFRHAEINT
jgi:hydroxymethylglutaryl-CoA lyase